MANILRPQLAVVEYLSKKLRLPRTVNKDALEFKTILNAFVHYLPQDIFVIGLATLTALKLHSRLNRPQTFNDIDAQIDAFTQAKEIRGGKSALRVSRKGKIWIADLAMQQPGSF